MKKNIAIRTFFVIQVFCAACLAINSPIGDPTVPPSSVQSGLRRSPNPINTSGNLTVTGNVSGGAQFRGFVPYRSTTDFGAYAGSSDLNSFLRRSAPINISNSQTSPQPYYLPSQTVSSMTRGGASGLITYPSIKQDHGTGYYAIPKYVNAQAATGLPATPLPYEYTQTRPLSYNNPLDLERLVGYGLMSRREQKNLTTALQRTIKSDNDNLKTNQQVLPEDESIPSVLEPVKPLERSKPVEPLKRGEIREDSLQTAPVKSIYEQMLEGAGQDKTQEQNLGDEQTQITKKSQPDITKIQDANAGGMRSGLSNIEKETAEAVTGVYKTFAAQTDDKFNYYMKSAEEFLKQGQYYRAADAYTLASIYKPEDPLAYAGKSHALFASGEYMSSAYYLVTVINIFPQYVKFKVDLHAMIPDKDRLESRIADIVKYIDKNHSPELSFLLAYVYYQLDKHELATMAINVAAEKMPDNQAVKVLRQAIENK
ncbi:MAG: hypothetical protein WC496_06620 [Phycisphaerae bacterium]|jgi:tetratricopeptide (TPR) repeat protein